MKANHKEHAGTKKNCCEFRALLVEIVNAEQFPGRVNYGFPFFRGWLAERGIPTKWIRFGISTLNQLKHKRDSITLEEKELARLLELTDTHKPTMILLTDKLHRPQLSMLRKHATRARIVVDSRDSPQQKPPELEGYEANFHKLERPEFIPLYDWEPGNEEATRKEIDNIYLALAGSCGHTERVADNSLYAGINDLRVNERTGCTFCENWIDNIQPMSRTKEEWIAKQIQGIALSRGAPENLPNGLLLERLESVDVLRVCLKAMEENEMAGRVQLLLAIRANQVHALERCMKEHFENFPGSKARFGVYASGFESFAESDLLLFNKGIKPLDSLRALNKFRELKREFPDRFHYSGITFILFTPWTTPETLHLNFRLYRFLGLTRKEAGNVFQSRLRLHPQISITAFAEREGLVVERETDPILIMNRRKLFGPEKSWIFKDGRLRPLSRIVLRYDLLDSGIRDSLLKKIRKRFEAAGLDWKAGDSRDLLDFTLQMIDVLRREQKTLREEELLARALNLWKTGRSRDEAYGIKRRIGSQSLDLHQFAERLAMLVKKGLKPAFSIEEVDETEYSVRLSSRLGEMGLSCSFIRKRLIGSHAKGTIYAASDKGILERLIELQAELDVSRNSEKNSRAVFETGVLLGYPECCACDFSGNPSYINCHLPLIFFEKRASEPGAVSPVFNPFLAPDIAFVPCSPHCAEATKKYERWFDGLEIPSEDYKDSAIAYIFPLDENYKNDLVKLSLSENENGMRYSIIHGEMSDRDVLKSLYEGDILKSVPGQLRIFKGERLIDFITATHGLWSAGKCLHAEEWREITKARLHRQAEGFFAAREEKTKKELDESRDSSEGIFDRKDTLRISFKERGERGIEYVFYIGKFLPGDRVFKAANSTGLVHLPCETGGDFKGFAEILTAVISEIKEPPNSSNLYRWSNAVRERFAASPLARRFICKISQK